jgi:DNA polymerase
MPSSKPDLLATLDWLIVSGADEAVGATPANHFVAAASPVAESVRGPGPNPPTFARPVSRTSSTGWQVPKSPAAPATGAPAGVTNSDSIGDAMGIAAACNSLGELRSALEAFDGCGLKKTATKTVFADGTPHHGIMLIGEAPGRDEDIAGLPFVGRAGKLLDKMLASIGLDRTTNAYITNVINWRPPGNRDPSPEEAASCLPFLRRHIELVSPGIIVLLGAVSVRHVMGRTDGIMRLRGKWLEYYVNGTMVPVMPTLHPAYLLRRAIDKKLAWHDLQEISQKVNSLGLLEHAAERR